VGAVIVTQHPSGFRIVDLREPGMPESTPPHVPPPPHPIAEFIAARVAELDGPLAALCRELSAEHDGSSWRSGDDCPGCSCAAGDYGCDQVEYPCRTIRLAARLWAEHAEYRAEWTP
jgi:hypothetical protein